MTSVLSGWTKTPRDRWYQGVNARTVPFNLLMATILVAWGVQGLAESPGTGLLLDCLKLIAGVTILCGLWLWVRRPLRRAVSEGA